MQPGYVRKDSISKCSTEDHLYSTIRNPVSRKIIPPKSIDTIESAQVLENNALQRLKMMHLPNEAMIVIARVGKFVFLAIALPPYIALYTIPKWFLMDAMPFFLHFTFKSLKLSNQKLKKVFDPAKTISNTLKNVYSSLKTKGAEYIQWINKVAKNLFVHLKHHVVARAYRILGPIVIPFLTKGFEAAEKTAKLLQVKTNSQTEVALKFVKLAAKTFKVEITNHFRPIVEVISKKYNQIKKFTTNHVQTAVKQLERFNKVLKHYTKKVTESLKITTQTFTKALITPIVSYVLKPAQVLADQTLKPVIHYSKQTIESFKTNFTRIKEFAGTIIRNTTDVTKSISNFTINAVKQVFEVINLAGLKQFFNKDKGFKENFNKFSKQFQENLKKRKVALKIFFEQTYKYSISKWFSFVNSVKKMIKAVLNEIKMLPKRLFKLAEDFVVLSVKTYHKSRETLSTFGFWTRIFFRYSWEEMVGLSGFISNSVKYRR